MNNMETLARSRGKRANKTETTSFDKEIESEIQSPLAELQNILPKEKRRRESRLSNRLLKNPPLESKEDIKVAMDNKKSKKKTNSKKADIPESTLKVLKGKKENNVQKEFIQEKKTRNKKADISDVATLADDMKHLENVMVSPNAKEDDLHETSQNIKPKRSHRSSKPSVEVYEEKIELIEEQIITVNVSKKGTQTLLQVDPKNDWPRPEMLPSTSQKCDKHIDKDLIDSITNRLPQLLCDSQFCTALTSQIKLLPEEKYDNLIKMLFNGVAEKRGLGCISLVVNLLQDMKKELENNSH